MTEQARTAFGERLDSAALIARIQNLPVLSGAAAEVMLALSGKTPDLNTVDRCLAHDPALGARVIRVANSPFFGLSGRIDTLRKAVMVLGLDSLRALVMAAGLVDRLPPAARACLDENDFWRHSLWTAGLSADLADRLDHDGERGRLAGILHDIGDLVVAVYATEEYCSATEATPDEGTPNDYAQIGAALAARWHFPVDIVEAIGRHRSPDDGRPVPLVDVVHVAHHACLAHSTEDAPPKGLSMAALARLGLDWPAVLARRPPLAEIEAVTRALLG